MGFVYHQEKVMTALCLQSALQIEHGTIHAVYAFADQKAAAEFGTHRYETALKRVPIPVRKAQHACARQARAREDAVMGSRIVDDGIGTSKQVTYDCHVGEVSADEDEGVFGAKKRSEALFQFTVELDLARNDSACRRRCP